MSGTQGLWRRILNALALGSVNLVKDDGPVQTAQIGIGGQEIQDNVPLVYSYGVTSNPPPQSDVVLVYLMGDRSSGIVVGVNHQPSRKRNLAPGEVAVYDDLGKSVTLTRSGIVINGGGQVVTVLNTPLLRCSGDIIDNYGSNSRTIANMRQIYDGHTHPGVQAGGASTATPTQQM